MDFDIGNILYIVITLVAVLIGVLGKKKKPDQTGSESSDGEARPSFLENLERVLTMDQEPVQVRELRDYEEDLPVEDFASEEPEEQIQAEKSTGLSILEEYERIMKRGSETNMDLLLSEGGIITEPLEVIDLDETPGTDYFEIVRDFDAGTAVVYSAIINRLDY